MNPKPIYYANPKTSVKAQLEDIKTQGYHKGFTLIQKLELQVKEEGRYLRHKNTDTLLNNVLKWFRLHLQQERLDD